MESWIAILTSGQVIATALFVGMVDEAIERAVPTKPEDTGWRHAVFVIKRMRPVLLGLLVWCIPWLPGLEQFTKEGFEQAGRLATGVVSGVLWRVAGDLLLDMPRRFILSRAANGAGASLRPPAVVPVEAAKEDEKP